jgi:hypothetical protein
VNARLLACSAVAAVVLAACSVPRDNHARVITSEPVGLAVPQATCEFGDAVTSAKVYYVRPSDGKLEARLVKVKQPGDAVGLLEALKCAPDGYASAIPASAQFEVRGGDNEDELTVLLFQIDVKRLNRSTQVQAFEQIVFTLWNSANVSGVRFSVNNQPYKVPVRQDDTEAGALVRPGDYGNAADTIYTTTTTTTAPPTTLAPTTTPASTVPASSAPPGSTVPPASGTTR